MTNPYLTADQVCEYLAVSRSTLGRLRKASHFPAAYRVGKRRLAWRAADIGKWLQGRKINKPTAAQPAGV